MDDNLLEELYPHLFERKQARDIVSSMLKVEQEAAQIKHRAQGHSNPTTSLEEDMEIAFQAYHNLQREKKEREALDRARRTEKKVLREFDPREAMEERHKQVKMKRELRKAKQSEQRDLEIERIREERKRLQDDVQPVTEAMRLAVKKEAEEMRRLDLQRKRQAREQAEREHLERERAALAQEQQEAERSYFLHKVERMGTKLTNVHTDVCLRFLNAALRALIKNSVHLKTIEVKLTRRKRFKTFNKVFAAWHRFVQNERLEREAERFRQEQERLELLAKDAELHYSQRLMWVTWNKWLEFLRMLDEERAREEELRRNKEKINRLFEFVKQRNLEEQRRKEELEQEELLRKQEAIRQRETLRLEEARRKQESLRQQEALRQQEILRHQEVFH